MSPILNVPHKFNLFGLKAHQSFVGCNRCWFRYAPEQAVNSEARCPSCYGNSMGTYLVTEEDLKNLQRRR